MSAKRMKKWNVRVMLVLAVAFLLAVIAESANAQVLRFVVRMNGAQEVPPVATAATGVGRLVIDTVTGTVTGRVSFTGLSTPSTAGHFHMAAAGVNGGVIIPLRGGVGVTAGVMRVPAGATLNLAQRRALRRNGLYLNIHTSRNPGGEIRGQIIFRRGVPVAALNEAPAVKIVSDDSNPARPEG